MRRRSSAGLFLVFLLISLLSIILSGCQEDLADGELMATVIPSNTSTPMIVESVQTATVVAAPQINTPTPTIQVTADCKEQGGSVQDHAIQSEVLNSDVKLKVYLPPCYEAEGNYPVLYLLHGQGYDETFWEGIGLSRTADRLIYSEDIVPFIIIMPQEEYYLREMLESRFGEMLVEELVPWVDEQFDTCTDRTCRAIGGNSRGALWAFRLAFKHWELFGAAGVHSLPDFGEPNALLQWQRAIPEGDMPRVYVDIGRDDRYINPALRFENLLTQYEIPHEWHLFEGGHDDAYWQAHLEDYLRWYAEEW